MKIKSKSGYHRSDPRRYLYYIALDPQKFKARRALRYAVAHGKIVRPSRCEKCLTSCIPHGHHTDYNKKLDVLWLCARCHRREHHNDHPKKLTKKDVINIKALLKDSLLSGKEIAATYEVSPETIYAIKAGRRWAWVKNEGS